MVVRPCSGTAHLCNEPLLIASRLEPRAFRRAISVLAAWHLRYQTAWSLAYVQIARGTTRARLVPPLRSAPNWHLRIAETSSHNEVLGVELEQ